MIFTERQSGNFLKKFGFNVIKSVYVRDKKDLKDAVGVVGLPCVVKVFGDKIVHKKKLGGVVLGVKSYDEILDIYDGFMKIKDAEGIVLQEEIVDKKEEFLVGMQKTSDFGHVVAFGVGGSEVEKLGKVGFRVCPFRESDALELVNENFNNLDRDKKRILVKVLLKCCKLAKKFPKINELDINPLVISKGSAIILDSRIVWE